MIGEDFYTEFQAEITDPEYLAHKDFDNCTGRANAFAEKATRRAVKVLALAIAKHRADKHGEDVSLEMSALTAELAPEDVAVSLRSWWNH